MATLNKDFRVKSGLVVEGSNATVNGSNVLTEASTEFLQDTTAAMLSGGTHTNISVSYNDPTGTISLTGAVTYTDEQAQDAAAAALVTNATHSGVSVAYNDASNAINITNTGVTGITGTSNQIAASASSGAVTLSLPTDVTLSGNLTINGTPSNASHAVTKSYVDNITAGLNFHAPARVATTANLTATYNNGTSGLGATLTGTGTFPTVDGITLVSGDRILVKDQTAGLQNGIYSLTTVSPNWVLTRTADADNNPAGELATGDFLFVQTGTANGGYGYILNTAGTITVGTTAVSYVQFNAAQAVIAGNGLTEATAGTLSIDTAITADLNTAQTLTNKTINRATNTITVTSADVSDFAEASQDAVATALTTNATHSGITVAYNDASNAINITNSGVTGITGTASQITASAASGSVTLSLPQNIATTSSPTFAGVTLANSAETSSGATVTTSQTAIDTWAVATYSSAKYLIQMKNGSDIEILEALVAVDGNNNVYVTIYGDVISNASLGTITADYLSGNVRLLITATTASTTVKVHSTYIKA